MDRPKRIEQIRIVELFGYNSFNLVPGNNETDPNLLILYGDNGGGKTTILRLLFCLLTTFEGRGYKSEIAKIPFREFNVLFNDGIEISARRTGDELIGTYLARITIRGEMQHEYLYRTNERNVIPGSSVRDPFVKALSNLELKLHFLQDNRRLQSTIVDDQTGEAEFWPTFERDEEAPDRFGIRSEIAQLQTAIRRLVIWFRQKTFTASSAGDASANSVVMEMLRGIVEYASPPAPHGETFVAELRHSLSALQARSQKFVAYGMTTRFPAPEMISLIEKAVPYQYSTISTVLHPIVSSYEARLDALRDIQELLTLLVTTVHDFFEGKGVNFSLSSGLEIWSPRGDIVKPEWFSSGERHLLLLFCNTILARDFTSIFLIDEPELSLNIKWQRQLLKALSALAARSNIQFIMASHSFELIAQHTDAVAPLKNLSGEVRSGPH